MTPVHITSPQNSRIKDAVALRDRRARDRAGLFLVEGARELGRAVAAGWPIDSLFVCRDRLSEEAAKLTAHAAASHTCTVTPRVFDRLALREGSDGIAAVLRVRTVSLADALVASDGRVPLVVALHRVEKPGNVGAVLRSADAVGATGVVTLEETGDPLSPNAIRASLGTVFGLRVARATSQELIAASRARGIALYAAALAEGAETPWRVDLRRPTCLVLGSEATGLPPAWLAAADACVAVPMRGSADSLNVSVAAAMILYEAMRQRRPQPPGAAATAPGAAADRTSRDR